jgi:hypothetical protein
LAQKGAAAVEYNPELAFCGGLGAVDLTGMEAVVVTQNTVDWEGYGEAEFTCSG